MNIKLIVMDMDGTLCESRKQIDSEMKKLIEKLSKNFNIAIFSGADKNRIKNQINITNINDIYLGEYSAAHIIKDDETIHEKRFKQNELDLIEKTINKYSALNSYIQISEYQVTYYLIDPDIATEKQRNNADPDLTIRKSLIEQLRKTLSDYDIRIGGKTSIDISKQGVSKKDGVDVLVRHLGIDRNEVLFIGDRCFKGGNDWMNHKYRSYNVNTPEDTKKILTDIIDKRPITVCVSGYFNPIHSGHIKMFEEAKRLGDRLIVIVNSDEQVKLKGSVPFMDEEERMFIVQNIKGVDLAVLSIDKDKTVCETLKKIKPDIFANGGDRFSNNVPEKKVCEDLNIKMEFNIGGDKTQSSSWLISEASKHGNN